MSGKKKRSSARAEPRIVNANVAGIDVGSECHTVGVPAERDAQSVRSFGVFTADLRQLAAWLKECAISSVVVESTGVYWMPLCDFLEEAGLEVLVVDPRTLARNLKKRAIRATRRGCRSCTVLGCSRAASVRRRKCVPGGPCGGIATIWSARRASSCR